MQEQQTLQIQSKILAKSNKESTINLKLNQEQSFQQDKLQEQKIQTMRRSKTEAPQQNIQKSAKAYSIFKPNQNSLKNLPKVIINAKVTKNPELNNLRYQKYRNKKVGSQKQLQNKSTSKEQEISRDILKHPMKYKLVRQLLACKPEVIFQMKPYEVDLIQSENMKIKGLHYLRQSLQKNKSLYNMKLAKFNKSKSKELFDKKSKEKQEQIRKIREQKLNQLVEKQQSKSALVFKRVKNHMAKGEYNFFAHLNSQESVDKAFVSFLKTKIKRAEMSCKL